MWENQREDSFILGLSRNFANILIKSKGVQCILSQYIEIEAALKLPQVLLYPMEGSQSSLN